MGERKEEGAGGGPLVCVRVGGRPATGDFALSSFNRDEGRNEDSRWDEGILLDRTLKMRWDWSC